MIKQTYLLLALSVLLLAAPGTGQAQFTYTTNLDATLTLTGYTGAGGTVAIPAMIEGLAVTRLGNSAFYNSHFGDNLSSFWK